MWPWSWHKVYTFVQLLIIEQIVYLHAYLDHLFFFFLLLSVGSLGRKGATDVVGNIKVDGCTFTDTQNGVRIKTVPVLLIHITYTIPRLMPYITKLTCIDLPLSALFFQGGSGSASNITFSNITMTNVENPIILTQFYCPHNHNSSKCKDIVSFFIMSNSHIHILHSSFRNLICVSPLWIAT